MCVYVDSTMLTIVRDAVAAGTIHTNIHNK